MIIKYFVRFDNRIQQQNSMVPIIIPYRHHESFLCKINSYRTAGEEIAILVLEGPNTQHMVIWVKMCQVEIKSEIYSKCPVGPIGKDNGNGIRLETKSWFGACINNIEQ